MQNQIALVGGPQDGKVIQPFPAGEWHAGATGWPMVLDAAGEPVIHDRTDGARYVIQRRFTREHPSRAKLELIYVWEPMSAQLHQLDGST